MLKVGVISRVPGFPEDPFERLRVRVFDIYLAGLDCPEMQAFQDFLASGNVFSLFDQRKTFGRNGLKLLRLVGRLFLGCQDRQ